jgi:hypothetical protein
MNVIPAFYGHRAEVWSGEIEFNEHFFNILSIWVFIALLLGDELKIYATL